MEVNSYRPGDPNEPEWSKVYTKMQRGEKVTRDDLEAFVRSEKFQAPVERAMVSLADYLNHRWWHIGPLKRFANPNKQRTIT
jgi:hypothetical protein